MSPATTRSRADQYSNVLRDADGLGNNVRFLGDALIRGGAGAEPPEVRLLELFRFHDSLHINERRDEPVKAHVADWKAGIANSVEVAGNALLNTLDNIRAEIDSLVSTAAPALLRTLRIVRTSDFGADGTFDLPTTQVIGSLFVGLVDRLPPGHELHDLVPIENQYVAYRTHVDVRVVILGVGGKFRRWYALDEILRLTAMLRTPQHQREQEAIEQAERERIQREASVQRSEAWRLNVAELKIRELEQREADRKSRELEQPVPSGRRAKP